MGGFDTRDIFLGFDGSIFMVGLGLRRVRSPDDDPIVSDLCSCFDLAEHLDSLLKTDLTQTIAGAASTAQMVRALRRRYRDTLAFEVEGVGRLLRMGYEDAIQEERHFFGLTTLH